MNTRLLRLLRGRRGILRLLRERPIIGIGASVLLHVLLVGLMVAVKSPSPPPLTVKRGQPLMVDLAPSEEPPPRGNPAARSVDAAPTPSRPAPPAAKAPSRPQPAAKPAAPAAAKAAPAPAAPPAPPSRDEAPKMAAAPPTPEPPPVAKPEPAPEATPPPSPPPPKPEALPFERVVTPPPPPPPTPPAPLPAPPQVAAAPPAPVPPRPPDATRAAGSPAEGGPSSSAESRPDPGAGKPSAGSSAPASGGGSGGRDTQVAAIPRTEPPDFRSFFRRGGPAGGGEGRPGGPSDGRGGIEGEPIPLDSPEPRYNDYLDRIRRMIKAKWSYPCVKNLLTQQCEYKSAQLVIEFGIQKDGKVPFVLVRDRSGYAIYDEFAVNAIKLASPFPPVPDAISRKGIPILARFNYVLEPSSLVNVLR